MNSNKLNKLTKKYIEIVTKDFDEPLDKKNKTKNINQEGGDVNIKDNDIININNILKIKKK
jgi:hypothetical protein